MPKAVSAATLMTTFQDRLQKGSSRLVEVLGSKSVQ